MKRNNIPEAFGILISFVGVLVIMGWYFDIGLLKSILPVWVSMKFSTALAFFFSGTILYFIARFRKKDRDLAVIAVPVMSMVIFLLMGSLLASTVLGVSVGVEEMFVRDSMQAVGSVTPGRPSVATMIAFFLVALTGILTTVDVRRLGRVPNILGLVVAAIGSIAVLGYCIDQPWIYFAVPEKSSAMAIHSAILFISWGIGAAFIERDL